MFNLTTKFILAVSVLFIGGVSAASAQLTDGEALKVSVPSAFVVSDKSFPAGVYTIERTPSTNDSRGTNAPVRRSMFRAAFPSARNHRS